MRWLLLFIAFPLLSHAAVERLVTLGGDVTEIVYALDAEQSLVARDSTSSWPPAAQKLPDVGYLRQLNAEGILALRPQLVLASAQDVYKRQTKCCATDCATFRSKDHRCYCYRYGQECNRQSRCSEVS